MGKSQTALRAKKVGQTFQTFKVNPDTKPMIDALRMLSNPDPPFRLLLIYGTVGNGKTHGCNALAYALIQKQVAIKAWTVADLFANLRASIGTNTLEQELTTLKNHKVLILDDWAKEYASGWEIARMEEVIDYRYRQGLATVLTTNRPLAELPDRIVSRFSERGIGKRVENKAKDWRLEGDKK